jgi:heme/copper-type cytochrome/quinol oxidase subunit 2
VHTDVFWNVVQLVIVGILGVISYFVKRIIKQLDDMEEDVQELKIKVAIILDRDRRRRLQDYEGEILGGKD